MKMHAEPRQQQTLSPRLQHAVRLLQLSSTEFAQTVEGALGSNPFLDAVDDEGAPLEAGSAPPQGALPAEAADAQGAAPADSPDGDGDARIDGAADRDDDGERDPWMADGASRGARADDGDDSPINRVPFAVSLADTLHGQLNVLPLMPRDLSLARAVIDSLDDDGYLRLELDELIAVTHLDPPAEPDELRIALRRVQSLEPAGVAARNVVECLQLQLATIACPQQRELARVIIAERLENLAAKDISSLARVLGRPVDQVAAACERIRRLDPRPGWRFGDVGIRYVTPDVTVKRVRKLWTAALNPAIVPKVRLHKVYAEMFERQRAVHPELTEQLREARWTLRNVEQRFATILGVSQAIVKRQQHFFDYGPPAIRPMGLKEIAEEVGVHESTVSRSINNKYMATPLGLFELRFFFSRAMTSSDGDAFSGTAIRGLVKEMLERERPEQPLSDAEIARQLAQQGFTLARRTVTKYRHQLQVQRVGQRRVGSASGV
ncbi:MAG TPA: RNA polymerase factor sigma-54 [Burkholderiaceae bacterium]